MDSIGPMVVGAQLNRVEASGLESQLMHAALVKPCSPSSRLSLRAWERCHPLFSGQGTYWKHKPLVGPQGPQHTVVAGAKTANLFNPKEMSIQMVSHLQVYDCTCT